ncbi:Ribosomal RNA small subunit methyltransferase B [Nymphon striatum]|nr:Ribosomal RNA small subunit methyltransferase B [Nymphon striatum]
MVGSGCSSNAYLQKLINLDKGARVLELCAATRWKNSTAGSRRQQFDAILLDAPCSSTGTIRRHPDVLWTRNSDEITELAKLQLQLLEEGEDLLSKVSKLLDDLKPDPIGATEVNGLESCINGQGALRTLPFHLAHKEHDQFGGLDGFFACRFIKR